MRGLLLLLPLWLSLTMGEGSLVHICPMHASPHRGSAHVHGMTGAHDPASSDSPASPDKSAPGDSHHTCNCLGTCPVVAGAALPSVGSIPAAVEVATHVGLPSPVATVRISRSQIQIPWANGPPSSI